MRKSISVILLHLLFISTYAFNGLIFKNIDVKNGLSDNYVNGIVRDSYGFMWFATGHGLDRFDGYRFKRYSISHLGDKSDFFAGIKEDGDRVLWVESSNHIYVYNRVADRIEDRAKEQFSRLGINDSIVKLYIDDTKNLWAVSSHFLYYYDFKKKALDKLIIQQSTVIMDITSIDRQAYVYMNDGKFYRIDWSVHRLKYEGEVKLSTYDCHRFYLDTSGLLWFYTAHSPTDKLLCYSTRERKWESTTTLSSLNNVILTTLIDDGRGNIWIGTENEGIYVYHSSSKQVEVFSREDNNEFSLACNHISVFYKDSQDAMWIGSGKQGVSYTYINENMFQLFRLKGKEDVSCMVEDTQGNLWIGFDGGGLAKTDSNGNTSYYYKGNGGLPTNLVTCSLIDKDGGLWIGTYGEGVLRLKGNKFERLQLPANSGAVYVRTMAEDDQGNLWIGTIDKGLLCYRRDGDVDMFTYDNSDLMTNSITSLTCDKSGHVYIGTSTGFNIYDNRRGIFLPLPEALEGISTAVITSVHKDRRGLIWIGCREGLCVYDEQVKRVYSITESDGLSHPYVRTIMEDDKENVLVATDKGLNNIRVQTDNHGNYSFHPSPYFKEDGLGDITFLNNANCLTSKGDCLIGCTNGYLRIRNRGHETQKTSAIVFTDLYLVNRRVEVGDETGILDGNLQLSPAISLNYGQNNFSIEVSAMKYGSEHRLHYQYRLKEVSNEWVTLTGNIITFNALSPGNYTLEVRAIDYGGWQSEISTLNIWVRPPFWRSWPAFAIYLLIASLLAWLYLRRMKKKHREMLAVQKLDMELVQQRQIEENKMKFFTNISHDLKTPLTLIITPIEKLLSGTLDKSVRTEMELVWRNARILMDEVTQLLDLRRLDVGAEELHLSHGDMVEFLRRTVDNFRYYSDSKGISLNLKINTPVLEMDFDQDKMRRVIMNLLSNAFKYNRPNGRVSVTLNKLSEAGKTLMQLAIADTGIGIKPKNKKHIFERFYQEKTDGEYIGSGIGLHIVKEYVTLQHGEIAVEDNHPEGTIFTITIPISQTVIEAIKQNDDYTEQAIEDIHDKRDEHKAQAQILIVEDNQDFRQFLERCLNDQYNVVTAGNGIEALQQLEQSQTDIVITDVMMPEMNGLELCNRIKTDLNYSHIPVIMLTAKATDENIIAGLKDGADEYITKPFNLNILKLRIQKILEWTEANHRNFGKAIDIAPSEITVSSIDEELIEKAMKVVEQRMNDSDFSVEEFSAAVGMTRGHLYKKLMAITGKSPLEFIRIMRIKRGKALLEQGRTNVSEVAYSVGFSPKQFAKYFKDEYGCLPSEFVRK